jgi:hypothetical protein
MVVGDTGRTVLRVPSPLIITGASRVDQAFQINSSIDYDNAGNVDKGSHLEGPKAINAGRGYKLVNTVDQLQSGAGDSA